jgi:hypothetical protein
LETNLLARFFFQAGETTREFKRLLMRSHNFEQQGRKAMKTLAQRITLALVICALAAFSALASGKVKKTITFATDTMVNGTLVKAGDYDLKFDKESGAVTLNKGGKVVATATGRLETRATKARETAVRTKGNELVAVSIGGSNQDLVLGSGGAATGNN